MPPPLTPLQEAVLAWGAAVRRDLPWRHTRDPWAVLVSELMLQQTQVARVAPRYLAFLAGFPTAAACAASPVGEVVRAWAGLGYNRRAVYLHATAVAVVERFSGVLPSSLDELRSLPGVGPYTARAVLAFAHERDVGVVDTNAARVLARAVAGRRLAAAEAQGLADSVVPPRRGWAWNQAVLDLGATVCARRRPRCGDCPLSASGTRTGAVADHTGRNRSVAVGAGMPPAVPLAHGTCAWASAGHAEPDPADGSAAARRAQSTFPGSDRQGRGRLVAALRAGPLEAASLAAACGWPDDEPRAQRAAAGLVADGLAVTGGDGAFRLP